MATETSNYHFLKPADSDPVDNTPLNTNFDSLDSILLKKVDLSNKVEVPASGAAEFTLTDASYLILLSRSDGGGAYIVHNGTNAGVTAILTLSDVSLSISSNTLTVANSGNAARCSVIRFF